MSWNPRDIPIERLSSIDEAGKRVWLYPAKVKGYYKKLRTVFYFFLLVLFLVVPWTSFGGEQTILLDIFNQRFIFFGKVFSAQDGPLIFFPFILAALGLVFVTSLWGRVWCGWACPQTVFLEAIFRRIDQWIEGSHSQRLKLDKEPWTLRKFRIKALKWLLFFVVCSHMSHSFTAYFIGAKNLLWISSGSPFGHWGLFLFVQILSLVLLFNFGWFREQFCIIMCPYGRFQSVLMGKESQAVLYDEKRGEPRKQPKVAEHGDCVDCYRCVTVCPMGIDIRRGLQMECIACTACMDACDEVMEKIDKPKGLIRYTSLSELETGIRKRFSVRSGIYLGLLLAIAVGFVFSISGRSALDVKVIRAIEAPYTEVGGTMINHFRLVATNQSASILKIQAPRLPIGQWVGPEFPLELKPGEHRRVHFFIKIPKEELIAGERLEIKLIFPVQPEASEAFESSETVQFLKP